MALPTYVKEVVNRARQEMLSHAQHALIPFARYQVYTSFWEAAPDYADAVYQQLCRLTAMHVLPLWEEVWPQDRLPHFILDTAEQLKTGTVARLGVEERAMEFGEDLLARSTPFLQRQEIGALCAAEAALSVLWTAIGRSLFGGATIETTDTDAEIDPWSSDTALWAANAVAGGVWDPESDSGRRRDFWLWWLDEAIPTAWHAASSTER